MLHLNPYWLVTRGVTVMFKFLTQDKDIQVNSSIQELPNKLTISHNYTYIDNIEATSFKFNNNNSAETSIKLDTQIEEMANNNFGIKNNEKVSPFVQALLDEEKQTNLYNNHGDSNIIDDDHVSNFRSKRSIEQLQRKDKDTKKLTFDLIKGDFLDLYNASVTKQRGIKIFTAHPKMLDSTYEKLSSVGIETSGNQSYIVIATAVKTAIPNNYLHLKLGMSPKNQPSLFFVNENGDSFVNITKDLSESARNHISQIRAPNKIQHYPINTIFDLKFNGSVGSMFHTSTKVAKFPNTQIVFEMFNNNDSDLRLCVKNDKKPTITQPLIHKFKSRKIRHI